MVRTSLQITGIVANKTINSSRTMPQLADKLLLSHLLLGELMLMKNRRTSQFRELLVVLPTPNLPPTPWMVPSQEQSPCKALQRLLMLLATRSVEHQ